jgi:hypothetical protein
MVSDVSLHVPAACKLDSAVRSAWQSHCQPCSFCVLTLWSSGATHITLLSPDKITVLTEAAPWLSTASKACHEQCQDAPDIWTTF